MLPIFNNILNVVYAYVLTYPCINRHPSLLPPDVLIWRTSKIPNLRSLESKLGKALYCEAEVHKEQRNPAV